MLSVVIIALNEEQNITNLLTDLASQSLRDLTITVADARSKDRTRDVARSFGAQVVDGGAPSVGRNAGAAATEGEIIVFLDADVRLKSEHFLEDMLKEMRMRRLDIAAVTIRGITTNPIDRLGFWLYNKYALLWGRAFPHAPGACIFVKRHVHDTIGGFDPSVTVAEDMLYARQANAVGLFGILKAHPVWTSPRRLRKDGRIKLLFKMLWIELYMLIKGPIRNKEISWDLDHSS